MEERNKDNRFPFVEWLNEMPSVLSKIVLKRIGLALVMLIITTISLFFTKDATYIMGYVITLLALCSGISPVWQFGNGKIMVARMIVCKVNRAGRKQIHVIMREAAVENVIEGVYDTFQYDITVDRYDKENFAEGTVVDIYFTQSEPNKVLAYEILGNT